MTELKIHYAFICVLCSLCIHANSKHELSEGIRFFEMGEYEKAKTIFIPLATNGNGFANYYLGLIHDPEFNNPPFSKKLAPFNPKNDTATVQYYKKAAEQGVVYATFYLGQYYQTLLLRRQKWKHGERLWHKIKEELKSYSANGDWLAKYMLANIYHDTHKAKVYANHALEALEIEAKKGNSQAQFYFGKSLSEWLCRTDKCKDYEKAYAWFAISAIQGSAHAYWHLESLEKTMNEHELAAAKKLMEVYFNDYRKQ